MLPNSPNPNRSGKAVDNVDDVQNQEDKGFIIEERNHTLDLVQEARLKNEKNIKGIPNKLRFYKEKNKYIGE